MGASVSGYWPGITDEQRDSLTGFDNDCQAWGNWMAECYNQPDVLDALRRLGVGALLSHITDGVEEDEVDWVSPDELMKAADHLRELVLAQDPRVKRMVETYGLSANGMNIVRHAPYDGVHNVAASLVVFNDAPST